MEKHKTKSGFSIGLVVGLLAFILVASAAGFIPFAYASEPSNENPPDFVETEGSVLLDDQALAGFIRTKVGDNLALGQGGGVGLQHDPDGPGGFPNTEDSNEGFFEERWCLEHDTQPSLCNAVFATQMPGGVVADTSSPGQLQATGSVTVGPVRILQVATLPSLSNALLFEVTLINEGVEELTSVEYLRNHDPDIGIDLGVGFTTDNQVINRPLPGAAPPMIVAATVRPAGETRTVGLGTPVLPPAGGISDVSIHDFSLVHSDPDETLDGINTNLGPNFQDVGNAIAWRIPLLAPGNSVTLDFCYAFAHRPENVDQATVADDVVDVFEEDCLGAIEVDIDIKPGSDPNSIKTDSEGVIPVAILSTDTFDALTVDHETVTFGPGGAGEVHVSRGDVTRHEEDVNSDGRLDLLFHFDTREAALPTGTTSACLRGQLFDDTPIVGCDDVRFVVRQGPPGIRGQLQSITFFVNHANCDNGASFRFFLNGVQIAEVAPTTGCICNSLEQQVTITDPELLANWNKKGPNTLLVEVDGFVAVGYIRAEIVAKQGSLEAPVFDALASGNAQPRDLCIAFVFGPTTFSITIE